MTVTSTSERNDPRQSVYAAFEPERLDALSDEQLDALPFGVIALDENGRIARYNLTEARFARLDRGQVVGRAFFGEVARCTATPEFEGRFSTLKSAAEPAIVRFEYVFAFRFGAQKVDIEMGTVPASAQRGFCAYICVNRRKFLPRLKDVPVAIEAPLIAELEPEALADGVARDAQGRRRVEAEVPMLTALIRTLADREQRGQTGIAREWGELWGRSTVAELEAESLERRGVALARLPMLGAMELAAGYLHRQKLGRLTIDYALAARGAIVLSVERSAFAEVPLVSGCSVFEGLFGSVFSHLASRPVVVRETSCRSRGEERCTFMVVSAGRTAAIERAVSGTASLPPTELLDAVHEEARRGAG